MILVNMTVSCLVKRPVIKLDYLMQSHSNDRHSVYKLPVESHMEIDHVLLYKVSQTKFVTVFWYFAFMLTLSIIFFSIYMLQHLKLKKKTLA